MYDTKIMHMQDILSAFLQLLAGPVFLIQKGQTFCGGAFWNEEKMKMKRSVS